MKKSKLRIRNMWPVLFLLLALMPFHTYADQTGSPFNVGETIRYDVHVSGIGFPIPLKIVFRTPRTGKDKNTVVELYINEYAVRTEDVDVPGIYRRLVFLDTTWGAY